MEIGKVQILPIFVWSRMTPNPSNDQADLFQGRKTEEP